MGYTTIAAQLFSILKAKLWKLDMKYKNVFFFKTFVLQLSGFEFFSMSYFSQISLVASLKLSTLRGQDCLWPLNLAGW